MKIERITLIALLCVGALFIPANALNDNEETVIEATGTNLLMNANSITYGLVEVNYDNTMDMWFIPKSTDQDVLLDSVGNAVGLYVGACNMYPELSDLNLMVGTKDNIAGKRYCKRDWADEVSKNTDGSYDQYSMGVVGLKVLGTFKKTS